MGRFEKGNTFGKGRPAGKLNASTESAKLTLARLAAKGLNDISEDMDKIREKNPVRAAEIYIKLLEYVVPRLKAVDMTVAAEVTQKVEKIIVEIKQQQNEEKETK
tara:strand:+ start:451 stop:765 length:315 start_codon:yes stop_codon:yes gene_type:complete